MLPQDGLYRYLYQSGEQHRDKKKKRQTTDFIWSKDTYRLDLVTEEPGNSVLFYLHDEPFTLGVLIHILEDTKVLPEWMSKWK